MTQTLHAPKLPPLRDLGIDLLHLPVWRRTWSLTLPFLWCAAYFVSAMLDCWPAAVFALMALSFVTYGSTSHDLVHRNLGLPGRANDFLLCVIELLALRSGHAYQAAHLHHHAVYPDPDDVEAKAARRSLCGSLAEGVVMQFRVWFWAMRHARQARAWIVGEGIACLLLIGLSVALYPVTPVFAVFALLMVMGSWIIPLITSYVPHDPDGDGELQQTRVFRGWFFALVALEHLYHLEHHQYPAVPHQNWPTLAKRLDPHLAKAGVTPIRFSFWL